MLIPEDPPRDNQISQAAALASRRERILDAARGVWPRLRKHPDWMTEAVLVLLLRRYGTGSDSGRIPIASLHNCIRHVSGAPRGAIEGQLAAALPQLVNFSTDGKEQCAELVLPSGGGDKAQRAAIKQLAERYAAYEQARWLALCSQRIGRKLKWMHLDDASLEGLGGSASLQELALASVLALCLMAQPEFTCGAAILLPKHLQGTALWWWFGLAKMAPSWADLKKWILARGTQMFKLFLQKWRPVPHLMSYGSAPDDPYLNFMAPAFSDTLSCALSLAAEGATLPPAGMPGPPAPRPSSSSSGGSSSAGDPFVRSLMQLLPDSLHPHLEPYAAAGHPTARAPAAAAEGPLVEVHLDEGRSPTIKLSCPNYPNGSYGAGGSRSGGGPAGGGGAAGKSHTQRYRNSTTRDLSGCQASVAEAIAKLELVTGRQEPTLRRTLPAASPSTSAVASLEPDGIGSSSSNMHGSSTDGEGDAAGAAAGAGAAFFQSQPPPLFGSDNRCCVPGSLHRISAMRDNAGRIYGLTYRVGRHTPGDALLLADLLAGLATGEHRVVAAPADAVAAAAGAAGAAAAAEGPAATLQPLEAAGSLLLVGRPGSGKTTVLRDVARLLADDLDRRVVVVDTSNEIAGDDRTPHPCIGSARRMMVPRRELLWRVMLEAVQNHGPEVLVVDELSTEEEVAAARSIAQRGVMLVATTHGPSLKSLLRNHTLAPLLGGIEAVTIGDVAARETNSGSKTRLERKDMPTFAAVVEVKPGGRLLVHPDAAESVDLLLPSLTASTTGGISGSSSLCPSPASRGPVVPPTRALSSADAAAAAGAPQAVRAAHLAGLAAAMAGGAGAEVATGSAESGPHTQLRYFDEQHRIWVEFSSAEAALRAGQLTAAHPQLFLSNSKGGKRNFIVLSTTGDAEQMALAQLAERYTTLDRERWLARCSQRAGWKVTWEALGDLVASKMPSSATEQDVMLAKVSAMNLLTQPGQASQASSLLHMGLQGVSLFWRHELHVLAPKWSVLEAWLVGPASGMFQLLREGSVVSVALGSSAQTMPAAPSAAAPPAVPPAAPAAAGPGGSASPQQAKQQELPNPGARDAARMKGAGGAGAGAGNDFLARDSTAAGSTAGGRQRSAAPQQPDGGPQDWWQVPHELRYGDGPNRYRNYMRPSIDPLPTALAARADQRQPGPQAPAQLRHEQQPAVSSDPFVRSLMDLLPDSLLPHLERYAGPATASAAADGSDSDAEEALDAAGTVGGSCGGGGSVGPPVGGMLVEVHLDEGRYPRLRLVNANSYSSRGSSSGDSSSANADGSTDDGEDGAAPGSSSGSSKGANISTSRELHGCEAPVREALEKLELVTGRQEPSLRRGSNRPGSAPAAGDGAPLFGSDNRCCVPGSLHRISAMRDNAGRIYGLTYRVGRHTPGDALLLADLLAGLATGEHRVVATPADAAAAGASAGAAAADGRPVMRPLEMPGSLLLVGRPGSGKTTVLRDVARLLADDLDRRVVVVDTSNEIAGDDRTPHPCIGSARRMMVPQRELLWRVMLEAVQNHGPEVLVVDELSTAREVAAARSIAQRGVMLVATTHGTSLKSLLRNHVFAPLLGGIETTVVTDLTARETNSGSKTRLERRDMPTFAAVVEINNGGRLLVHPDAAESVDLLLPSLTASTTGGISGSSSLCPSPASRGPVVPPTRALSSADAAAAAGAPQAVRAAHLAGLAAAMAGGAGAEVATGSAESGPHTQLRYFDEQHRIWVEFSSAEAALRAGVRFT
ncbi:hypothetical protein HYH02_007710 [Chlamydomonas schloesseri]|uniref:AAA+ ATPase domain-containing protein n=1 Tax=Chlamydomonas schloesseri TaxID=2026947 RepID=A0A836B4I8_9CHLO|nr:hypothetical protein HYH02_007710 [Chlamydomonas schloesseri]|eukprot:KAG2447382.1 hypothetical protein HYH02_007710 [Chlamydomonas schloesseri]